MPRLTKTLPRPLHKRKRPGTPWLRRYQQDREGNLRHGAFSFSHQRAPFGNFTNPKPSTAPLGERRNDASICL